MKIYLRLISLWLCFGSLYLLMRRLLFTDAQDMRMIFSVVIYSWLYVFFAMITSGTSKKKFNIFLYLLLVVFLSMSVEHLFMSYTPNTWKDNTMAFFGDIFCFILIWVSSILASKLMIRGYRRLKNVAIVQSSVYNNKMKTLKKCLLIVLKSIFLTCIYRGENNNYAE